MPQARGTVSNTRDGGSGGAAGGGEGSLVDWREVVTAGRVVAHGEVKGWAGSDGLKVSVGQSARNRIRMARRSI